MYIMDSLFDSLKQSIKGKISKLNYNTWFRPLLSGKTRDESFLIEVPNKFVADWISDYYCDLIKQELFLLTQVNYKIEFEITQDSVTKIKPQLLEEPQPTLPKLRSIESLNPKYSFDKFVVGSSNQFAHAACKAVGDLPGGHYNPLFLYGGVGLGKTHLLHAIGLALLEKNPAMQIVYVSAERFMNELINGIRYERTPEFRKKYRDKCDVLLMDDVQFLGGKERTQDEFFHTFNTLHELQRQIVVTSDKLPRDIQGIEERLRSRFEWGLIADIGPPDLETRIAILKKKSETLNLHCPDDVAMFLASVIKTNVRELEGSLIRINAFASLTGNPITVDLTREILGSFTHDRYQSCTIESVQKVVADFYKLNVSDLKSPRRQRSLAYPRQIAMYLCKKHVLSSFPEIGSKFGGKDHTTVMHACKKIERLLESDSNLQHDLSVLEKTIVH